MFKNKNMLLLQRFAQFRNLCQKKDSLEKSGNHTNETNTNVVHNKIPVLLQTAEILIGNPQNNQIVKVRALFDSGSQRTFISERVAKILKLTSEGKENISLNTFANSVSKDSLVDRVKLNILPRVDNENKSFEISALCLQLICLPLKKQPLNYFQNLPEFAELNFAATEDTGNGIDLLIGSTDFYWSLLTGNVKALEKGSLVAIETKLGWVFSGPVDIPHSTNMNVSTTSEAHVVLMLDNKAKTNESHLSKFWDFETLGITPDELCDEPLIDPVKLNEKRRYEASLPFKKKHSLIYDNYNLCEKLLMKLYSCLKGSPELLKQYIDIFTAQMELGIVEEVKSRGIKGEVHYLPYHSVIRDDKTTTKVRIVFDASSKETGPSLNECLHKGPQTTPLIFNILLRFRTFKIALVADIEKAFLQIAINEKDRDSLRFLWFDNVFSEQPKIVRNRFARVIFGVTSLRYLVNETICKHAQKHDFDIDFINTVFNSFYVSDFVGGENSLEGAFLLFRKLKLRFLEGLFHLKK